MKVSNTNLKPFMQYQQHMTFSCLFTYIVALMLDVCQPYLSLSNLIPSLIVSPVLVIQFHLSLWMPLFLVTCLSERLNCIPPLSSAFWSYLSKVFSLCGHISRLLFLFSLWPLPFLVIFHLTSMNSNSYNMPLCTYFSTISRATSIQYTHFLDLSHIPLSKTFPFLHLSLYLSLCVFMCTMCVRPSRVFFTGAVLLCGDRLSWCFPAAFLYSGSLRSSSPVVSSQTRHPDLSVINASILCYMSLASSNCATE